MIRRQLRVHRIGGLAEVERGETAVAGRQLLLDDVGLDGDSDVVRLTRQIRRERVVDPVLLEGGVAQVAPENRRHPELMRLRERARHLLDLTIGTVGTEVDRRAHRDCADVPGLLDSAEHDLVELVRVGQQLVVVELDDERNSVRPVPRERAEHAERRRHRVAPTFDSELHDLPGVEVLRVGSERRARRVLDALVDREDRDVPGAGQAAVLVDRRQVAQDAVRAVGAGPDAIDEVRPRQVQQRLRHRLASMLEQG